MNAISLVAIAAISGGLLGFGLTVTYYSIRQARLEREGLRIVRDLVGNYGQMPVADVFRDHVTVDSDDDPGLQSYEYGGTGNKRRWWRWGR